jgi:hypothetical protein
MMRSRRDRLVLIPSPFGDETFGSWLRRSADAYHTTVRSFVNFVLGMDSQPRITPYLDWDTAPPPRLLEALASRSAISASKLEYLVVHKGPATLPPTYRDTYCSRCFEEDFALGAIYIRKAWLDAWTLSCPTHGCLLGRFSAFEYRQFGTMTHFPQGLYSARDSDRIVRSNPVVGCVRLSEPKATHVIDSKPFSRQPWFDPAMLKSMIGRDLMMIAGSEEANCLHQELFGFHRPAGYTWQGEDDKPVWWPAIQHPLASIDVRIHAAYVASLT